MQDYDVERDLSKERKVGVVCERLGGLQSGLVDEHAGEGDTVETDGR